MLRVLFLMLVVPLQAAAHDARPVSVSLQERVDNVYQVSVRPPPSLPLTQSPAVRLPADCERLDTVRYQCASSLDGREISLDYPGTNPSLSAFVRFERADGSLASALLAPDVTRWTVPAGSTTAIAGEYTWLGITHIALGLDHLLFIACLVVLAWGSATHRWRRLLLTVTGFTLAHSVTLALSVLDVVRVSVPLVEALIALSILFVAAEILDADKQTLTARHPAIVASLFGLLHGFGFAAVLREIGLPSGDVPLALFAFNVGVEIGQVIFVALVLSCAWLLGGRLPVAGASFPVITAYIAGGLSGFWVIDRTISFWM